MGAMKIGQIPSLTWNKLDINFASVDNPEKINTQMETRIESLPEGVTFQNLSVGEADRWIQEHAPAQPAENVIAGKRPIYHPQKFATGLGAEFEDYLKLAKGGTTLIETAENVKTDAPVTIDFDYQSGNRVFTRQIIHVSRNSSLTLILVFRSAKDAAGMAGIQTRVVLDEGADLALAGVQLLGNGFVHYDDLGAALKTDAGMKLIQLELGAGKTYTGVHGELSGDRSVWDSRTGYLGQDAQVVDLSANLVQRGRKTRCEMKFNGVLDGAATKRLSDTIDFRRGSRGSYGHESEDVLLLGDDAVNKSLPVILCEEEDMEGSHGASIGRLDDDMLFYMASRGIDEKQAQQIMVRARLSAVAKDLPDENLKNEIHDFIEEAFR